MLRRYRYRAYPTGEQRNAAAQVFGCVRVAWNDALAARENARKNGKPIPTTGELSAALTASKKTPQRSWMRDVSSVPLQQSLNDLDRAYRSFFASVSGNRKGRRIGAPRFKKRGNRQSARFTRNAGFTVTSTGNRFEKVRLPKIGHIRFASSRPLPSDPTSVTLIAEPDGRFYVSFAVDTVDSVAPEKPDAPVAGVDLGLTDLATVVSSDGSREKIANPRWLRSRQRQLAKAQKALSRKKRGSANRDKARRRVAVCHRKIRDARLDHHHKLSLRLVRENQAIGVEGLSVAGLARARLAKSVHDAGWGILLRLLAEKAEANSCRLVIVDRWEPTSQTCSVCGHPGGPKPLDVRVWDCPNCGTRLDRDFNAGVNILVAAGLAETVNDCGEDVRRRLASATLSEAVTHRTVSETTDAA